MLWRSGRTERLSLVEARFGLDNEISFALRAHKPRLLEQTLPGHIFVFQDLLFGFLLLDFWLFVALVLFLIRFRLQSFLLDLKRLIASNTIERIEMRTRQEMGRGSCKRLPEVDFDLLGLRLLWFWVVAVEGVGLFLHFLLFLTYYLIK